jgi:hypothetical protein
MHMFALDVSQINGRTSVTHRPTQDTGASRARSALALS